MKPIFVKYYGFSGAERHALHTLFRLSESHRVVYAPWTAESPDPPQLVLIEGDSWEAALALANPLHDKLKLAWVGAGAPAGAWRVFASPVKWSALIEAMDEAFLPVTSTTLSLDLDLAHDADMDVHLDGGDDTEPMALERTATTTARRVLVVDAGRDERLYLRAKLSSAGFHEVDEAASGAQALELLRGTVYGLVIVDLGLADMDSWQLIKAVDGSRPAIAHMFITGSEPAWRRGLQARFSGAQVYLPKPLDPEKLRVLLQKI